MHLLTERLVLAPHDESDVDFMIALNADREVVKYTGDGPLDRDQAMLIVRQLARQRMEHGMGRLVVLDRGNGERLGWCGLKWTGRPDSVDLGYRFFQKHWGRGLATEAARACLAYGFDELGLQRIVAEAHVDNARSIHVLEKLGFGRTGQEGSVLFFEIVTPGLAA